MGGIPKAEMEGRKAGEVISKVSIKWYVYTILDRLFMGFLTTP
jgi:hypothetical protein